MREVEKSKPGTRIGKVWIAMGISNAFFGPLLITCERFPAFSVALVLAAGFLASVMFWKSRLMMHLIYVLTFVFAGFLYGLM